MNSTPLTTKLRFACQEGFHLLEIREIVHCQADGNYTTLYLADQKKLLLCRQLGLLEKDLPAEWFVRAHHSHIINLYFLEKYEHSGFVRLHNGHSVPVSRRKKGMVLERLKAVLAQA